MKRRSQRADVVRRRRLAALVCAGAVVAGGWAVIGAASSQPARTSKATARQANVTLYAGGRRLATFSAADYRRPDGRLDRSRILRAVLGAVPGSGVVKRARARIAVRYLRPLTAQRVGRKLMAGGGSVGAVRRPFASVIDAPIVKQSMRNDCEAAALSIMMATLGANVNQNQLQAEFPRSGPLDPQGFGSARIWGDPERGYVGRADGGGTAGGFGIYPPPLVGVARREKVRLSDLTGSRTDEVYARLLRGEPVMVWVGLSNGPYGEWRSPRGRPIRVNFGEHTVVLAGVNRDGTLRVSNPLQGTSERWTRSQFEAQWDRLGRRALGVAA